MPVFVKRYEDDGGAGDLTLGECDGVVGGGRMHSMLEGWSVAVVGVGMFVMVIVSGVLSGELSIHFIVDLGINMFECGWMTSFELTFDDLRFDV